MLTLACGGCATYQPVRSPYHHRGTGLKVPLPDGWLRFTSEKKGCVLTKDGLRLERISIHVTKFGKELPGTERTYRPGMLPHEIAQLSLGLLEADEDRKDFEMEALDLATVAGNEGYKACASFTDLRGLRKRLWLYGAAIDGYVCEFRYEGAATTYFDKYLPVFERMVASAGTG